LVEPLEARQFQPVFSGYGTFNDIRTPPRHKGFKPKQGKPVHTNPPCNGAMT
jgi:hypothetical protein